MPNNDAGNRAIRETLGRFAASPGLRLIEHMQRERFVSWMAAADVMVGNSSAGIIEAASLGLRVVNIGSRQQRRERSENVIDVSQVDRQAIGAALARALRAPRQRFRNIYGDGCAGERIVELLATFPIDRSLLQKTNAY
jgi:GDP/UDP-N,N'-diacetylbacillosamine 2-epimerase (hydrolysing)